MNSRSISRPCHLFALAIVLLQTLSISNKRRHSSSLTPSGKKRKSSLKVCRTWQVEKRPHLLIRALNSQVMITVMPEKLTMIARSTRNSRRATSRYACHPRGNPRSSSSSSRGGKKRRRRPHHPSRPLTR